MEDWTFSGLIDLQEKTVKKDVSAKLFVHSKSYLQKEMEPKRGCNNAGQLYHRSEWPNLRGIQRESSFVS